MQTRRLSALGLAVASAFLPMLAGAATNAELEQALLELKAKVEQLETALAANKRAAEAPAPATQPVQDFDQKVRAIERRLEVAAEEATANRLKTPIVTLGDKGLSVLTPDGNFELKLRGYLQADARLWVGDDAEDDVDTLLFRRARPIIEGTVFKQFYYRLMPDFAGSAVSFQDAYAEWRQFPYAKLAVGKFKEPIGLERLASGSELAFVERGLSTNLVPNRDFGIMLNGDVLGGAVNYAAGVFNGVPDLGSIGVSDTNDDKDFGGRLFVLPFKDSYGPLQGLGLGIAGSYGKEEGSAASPNLGSYLTPAQARFFRYRTTSATATLPAGVAGGATVVTSPVLASTTVADGDRYRIAPQAYWYWRQFGLLGEYVESSQEVNFGAHRDTLTNTAWQLAGSWVLTGEDASYKSVKPKVNFDPLNGTWGAFELTARYGQLDVDDDAFSGITTATAAGGLGTAFADPRQAASEARSWGTGLNWYFNKNFKLNLNYEHTWFEGGGGGTVRSPRDRETEKVVLTRVQIVY